MKGIGVARRDRSGVELAECPTLTVTRSLETASTLGPHPSRTAHPISDASKVNRVVVPPEKATTASSRNAKAGSILKRSYSSGWKKFRPPLRRTPPRVEEVRKDEGDLPGVRGVQEPRRVYVHQTGGE
jgi:hypothetical protein